MDAIIFNAIYGLAGKSELLDYFGIFLARYLAFVLIAILGVLSIQRGERGLRNRWIIAEALVSAAISRLGFVTVIRMAVHRARPFIDGAFKELISISPHEFYGSFPSGHASFFFGIAMTVWLHNRKLGWYFFGGAFLMGLGRVFVGVHWPSDILVGAVLGISVGWFVHLLWNRIVPRTEDKPLS